MQRAVDEGISSIIFEESLREALGGAGDASSDILDHENQSRDTASGVKVISDDEVDCLRELYVPDDDFGRLMASISSQRSALGTGTFLSFEYIKNDFILLSLIEWAHRFLKKQKEAIAIDESIQICLTAQGGATLFSTSIENCHYIFIDVEVVDRCLNISDELFYSSSYTSRFDPARQPFYTMKEGASRLIRPTNDKWDVPNDTRCKDKERRELIPLCLFACTFLIAHELSHITNGHLSARAEWTSLASSKTELASIRRALEFDADAQAVAFFLSSFDASVVSSSEKSMPPENTRRLIISISIGLKAMEGVVSSRSLGSHEYDSEKPYLPIGRRIYDCLITILSWARRSFPVHDLVEFNNIVRSDFLALEHLSVAVFHRGSAVLSLGEGLLKFGDTYTEIADTWQRLRPILIQRKLGKHNLAP